ncbi:MAG: Ig-like domain-containing protein [Owenweeksia sp.]
MERFRFPLTLLILGLVFVFFEAFLSSCASRASPSGGPRDTIAPVLDTAFPPNFSTRFKGRSIELVFNEYLNLKSPGQQIMISPPVENKPEIVLKGRRIFIELKDSLLANTTYTISFGTSITDYTEGNENRNFKYVFSTGTYIDSLEVSGRVYDAYTNEGDKDLLVALYEINSDTLDLDSLPYKKIPTYYAYLQEGGVFKMENLKASKFMLLAFDDQRGDFKLNGSGEKVAFNDSLVFTSDTLESLVLRSFKSEPDYKFYGARHSGFGQIAFNFSKPVPDIKIESLQKSTDPDSVYLDFNSKKDTLTYWFKAEADSMSFRVSGYDGIDDTARLFLREFQKPKLKFTVEQTELRVQDSILLSSNLPLLLANADSFQVFQKDTFSTQAFLGKDLLTAYLLPAKRPKSFKVKMMQGAMKGWYATTNDSADWSFTTLGRDDLGNLDFSVSGDSATSYVLEIYDPAKKKILEKKFSGSTLIKLRNFKPGSYQAQLVVDENDDGQWTSGSYFERRQPEKILKYTEGIQVRANWDLELEWVIKSQDEIDPDPLKKKNAPGKRGQRPF